jgi:hypothetical protein
MKATKYIFLSVLVILTMVAAVTVTRPSPSSPVGNVSIQGDPDNIILKWSKSGPVLNFDHYEIQVAKDSTFLPSTIVDEDLNVGGGDPANNTYTISPGALERARRYYWRVRAVSIDAVPTAWSVAYFRTSVAPPALVAPVDNAVLLNNRPTFEWTPVLNADSYTLQVSLYADFKSTLVNATIAKTKNTYTPTADLPMNKELYWRMRTNSSAFGPSEWTDFFTLTTAVYPPSAPELLQPRSGKVTYDYSPRLVWTKAVLPAWADFTKYEVQIATNKNFDLVDIILEDSASLTDVDKPCFDINPPGPLEDCGGAGTDDLDPAKTYYWRVRTYNALGEYSNWSTIFILYTSLEQVTNLVAPLDGEILATNKPLFDWDPVTGANHYRIVVSRYPSMTTGVVLSMTAKTSEYIPRTNLPPNTVLYWRVRAEAPTYGPGMWSEIRSFTSANPPKVPSLVSPKSNALTTTYTPTFVWGVSTVPPTTTFNYYEIEVDDNTLFSSPLNDTIPDQYVPYYTVDAADALDPVKRYYWRVRACNDSLPIQCSDWSKVYILRTSAENPNLVDPVDGDIQPYPTIFTFKWDNTFGATSYTIQISKYANIGKPFLSTTVALPLYTYNRNLGVGTYYWRVRANNSFGFGPGAWSDIWSFEVTP